MNFLKILEEKKGRIISEISKLGAFRKGSLTEQYLKTATKDGDVRVNGPYWVYTYKVKRKTHSRRIKDLKEREEYLGQIENFRRFQQLMNELSDVQHQLADIDIDEDKKKLKK